VPGTRERLSGERGQTAAEYTGLLVLVAAIVLAVGSLGLWDRLGAEVAHQVCLLINEERLCPAPEDGDGRQAGSEPQDLDGVDDRERSGEAPGRASAAQASVSFARPGVAGTDLPATDSEGIPLPTAAPPPDPGAGAFDSRGAGLGDRMTEAKWKVAADVAEVAEWTNAARHMRHYLGESGETLSIEPERIVRDEPTFERDVRADARSLVADAQRQAAQAPQPGARFSVRN
jgi:Flp pilus assembly pilin Flp